MSHKKTSFEKTEFLTNIEFSNSDEFDLVCGTCGQRTGEDVEMIYVQLGSAHLHVCPECGQIIQMRVKKYLKDKKGGRP